MRIKNRIVIIFILLVSFLFTGCQKQKDIYDNDEKIISKVDSSFRKKSVGSNVGNKYDYKYEFTGIETIWTINSKGENTIELMTSINMDNDNYKLILVNSKDEILTLAEGNYDGKIDIPLSDGKNYIKVVSKGSKGEVSLELEETNSNIKIR